MARSGKSKRGVDAYNSVARAIGGACPQLYSLVARSSEDFISVSVRQRGEGDFVGVVKRYDGDGRPEVAFSNGYDFLGCLLGLEGTIAASRWREDRPWTPDKG